MVCPTCGAGVVEGQAYCTMCGASLRGVTDKTQELEPAIVFAAPDISARAPVTTVSPLTAPSPTPTTVPAEVATTSAPAIATTAEIPAVFDGHGDVASFPEKRQPFRVKFALVASFVGAIAALMAAIADVIDVRTTRPTAGITTGAVQLDDIATNLGPAGVLGAAVMLVGGLLACFGLRWAAGLTGGAGLGLAGWAAITLGLVEVPVGVAESITRTSNEAFTLTITRDVGWWLVVGVGVIGLAVFVASLRSIGRGGHRAHNPLLAAAGATCALVLATGPLVPVGDATWRDNFRSPTAAIDLPDAFFAGRLIQVGLIALVGVVGFLLVRNYGLGLVAGGTTVGLFMWVSSLTEAGTRPAGIADRNPGATDTVPHAVTTIGMVSTVVVVLIATIVSCVVELTSRRRT